MTGDDRVHDAIPGAMRLVMAVHDYDLPAAWDLLTDADLPALAVALAAMVNPDARPSQLLGWTRCPATPARQLMPCGTHAAYVRHKKRGEEADPRCLHAEREYQRDRKRRTRAAA